MPVRPDSRLQTLFLLQLLHAMLEHVTLVQRQDECMDQSYNAHEENESRRLCSPAVSTAAWTTRLRLSPIKGRRRETERERGREGERESTQFKRGIEHLYLRQPIHGTGQRGDSHVDGVKMKH